MGLFVKGCRGLFNNIGGIDGMGGLCVWVQMREHVFVFMTAFGSNF